MANIDLPDLSLLWSSAGDILKPSDSKIQQGWSAEVPPRQWFNWLDNRQDQAIAHIAQHGIAVWSDTLEYQAGKSYVQGSDGSLYKAITTNTDVNPVGNSGADWSLIATAPFATTTQAQQQTSTSSIISPSLLSLAFKGSNQQFGTTGFQKLPGGLILQWGDTPTIASGSNTTITLPTTFPTAFFTAFITHANSGLDVAVDTTYIGSVRGRTLSSLTIRNLGPAGAQFYWLVIGN